VKPYKLLIIDKEQAIVDILKRGLERTGCTVDGFTDSRQAIIHFKPNYYDAVITNICNPSMKGIELARHIWEIDPNAQVCFMSALDFLEDELRAVVPPLKSSCFLRQPFSMTTLLEHIEMHVKARSWQHRIAHQFMATYIARFVHVHFSRMK
jgi:DNA-binding response OmpR family regulator